jgi:hypothetical protein
MVMAALAGAALLPGAPASACGGLFCDRPPPNPFDPPPVAQTGENVLFAMEGTDSGEFKLEAHIQIFYTGPADKFSWVVPVDSPPSLLDVGTNRLFNAIEPMTRPTFRLDWKQEGVCRNLAYPTPSPTAGAGGGGGFAGGADAAAAAPQVPGVNVSFQGTVGPYNAAVVMSTDPNDPRPLKDWLATNMYFVSDQASRLIDDYVKEGKHFVAIRLTPGRGVNEIAPLVMKFVGPGPCVPLRLTSIAAINDLRVNLWVLAQTRVVPENYYEIKVNPTRIDWFGNGANYDDLVKQAADEAGGNAFVTDYVGPASIAKGTIDPGTYDVARLAMRTTPPEAVAEVLVQNYPRDNALMDILRKHIPEPESIKAMGVTEANFYNQIASYWQRYARDFAPFDSQEFAADVNLRIVLPVKKAQALFDHYPKLTRLSTFISPEEMVVDPLFMANSTLPDVPVQRSATAVVMCGNQLYSYCNAPVRLELPDGQKVLFAARNNMYCYGQPALSSAAVPGPALEVAWKRAPAGEGAVRFDNRKTIQTTIDRNNSAVAIMPPVVVPLPGMGPMPNPSGPGAGSPGTPAAREGGACALASGGGGGTDLGLPLLITATLIGGRLARRGRRRK